MEHMTAEEYKKLAGANDKAVRARIQGIVNRRNGELFENLIEASCNHFRMKGIAYIEKTPEPMRPISKPDKRGRFTAVFEKMAQADYKGALKGGKAIAFEAKHTDADRIQRSAVSDEQEKCLDSMLEMGAECFVIVSFGFQKFYKVPWGLWKNMKQLFGRKYLKPEDITEYRIKYDGVLHFVNDKE